MAVTLVAPERRAEYDAEAAWRQTQQVVGLLTGQADWASDVHILEDLTVDGTLTIASLVAAGDVLIGGTLGVTGDVNLGDDLNVVDDVGVGGTLAVTDDATLSGRLLLLAAAARIVGGSSSLALRNNADSADNLLLSDAGAATIRNGLTVTAGTLAMGAAASRLVPGATSFSIRDTANGADNLLVTDGGVATARGGLVVANGDATVSGGDLALSVGKITMGTAASQLVPGSSSFSIRNSANGANNLLVTDAGAVTTRSTLTVAAGGLTVTAGGATISAGDLAVSGGAVTASSTIQGTRLISTVATGTAPLTVASTTLVANLNASRLNDKIDTAFAQLGAASNFTTAPTINGSTIALIGSGASFTTLTGTTYLASGATPATSGAVRVPNNDSVSGRDAANGANLPLVSIDSSDNIIVGASSGVTESLIRGSTGVRLQAGGVDIVRVTSAGALGFYNITPVTRATVTGSRGGNAALLDVITKLENLGLIINATSA